MLEEIAKVWKKSGGAVIVEGDGNDLKTILRNLESSMSGGRLVQHNGPSRQGAFPLASKRDKMEMGTLEGRRGQLGREDSQDSFGISALDVEDGVNDNLSQDPRQWIKVIGAFEQPRLLYSVAKKHFEISGTAPSLLPDPSHKTHLFRHRYNLIHQRLLRNDSFQASTTASSRTTLLQRSSSSFVTTQHAYKLTPIANLLGRSASGHLLLGLLTISPTGNLALNDLTGSITLDTHLAKPIPEDGAWFTPGMIVLVDGVYEEESSAAAPGLEGDGGVGGLIGGKFIAFSIGGPPCERREVTLGINLNNGDGNSSTGGGFGWVDFLGVGSERASGPMMRGLEQTVLGRHPVQTTGEGKGRMVIMGEMNLDSVKTVQALKKVLGIYAAEAADQMPMAVVLMGNFVQYAVMAGGGSGGSIEYKEYFDSLASALSEYPAMLQAATFIFVPGDNDPWASAFSAGAATLLPRKAVPELFTSRIKRAFAAANAEAEKSTGKKTDGEAIWMTNPARLTLFGPAQEIVLFRDDISARLRRNAIHFQPLAPDAAPDMEESDDAGGIESPATNEEQEASESMEIDQVVEAAESHIPSVKGNEAAKSDVSSDMVTARKLVKTILDQGYLSPFPLSTRPVLWDYAGALQLYPLPTALVMVDPEAPPFAVTYEGCHVMNPGPLVSRGRRGVVKWMEYDTKTRRGKVRETMF